MTRKLPVIVFSLLLLIFVSKVNAQNTTTGSAKTVTTTNTQTATDAASKLKQQMQLIKDQKQTAVSLKQQIKERIQTKKEEIKEIVATKREEFKAKIQTIKDQKKKALVERIDTKLGNVNTKHTDRYAQALSDLQTFLDRITQSTTGTNALTNTATAQAAIDSAKLAVENQAVETYTITISTETALRSDVGTIISQLRQDLTTVHKLVVDAKQAIQKLNINKELIKKETTSSAEL